MHSLKNQPGPSSSDKGQVNNSTHFQMKFRPLYGAVASLFAALIFDPHAGSVLFAAPSAYPGANAQTLAQLVAANPDAQQVVYEMQLIMAAEQTSPFNDNMVGGMGSGKPFINHPDTTTVAGQVIVIPVYESLGGPGIYGGAVIVGNEEQLTQNSFRLQIGLYTQNPVSMTAQAWAESIPGEKWPMYARKLLSARLGKKLSDDKMMTLVTSATGNFNVAYPNNKSSVDQLLSADRFQTSLIEKAGGLAKDIGAIPCNLRKAADTLSGVMAPPILQYIVFSTDAMNRPIKNDQDYLDGVELAQERGSDNPLFTGQYQTWDGHVIYSWQNIQHAAPASIGSALQPEALLGSAILARTSSTVLPGGLTSSATGGILGGGTATFATLTFGGQSPQYFEFFDNYTWTFTNGLTGTIRTGTRYFAIVNGSGSDVGKISFFSFTTNNGNQLSGLKRLGSVAAVDYATTIGDVTWNSGAWTTAASGGFAGVTDGAIPIGSHIYETNAKGVPIGAGFVLGEMAGVCGYGRLVDQKTKAFKTMASFVEYDAPYGQSSGIGVQISHGTAAFQRVDTKTPNYVLFWEARDVSGFPSVTS